MAGHSKFKNIMHRKGAQDKKRAKVFGRLIKELTVAARILTPLMEATSEEELLNALQGIMGKLNDKGKYLGITKVDFIKFGKEKRKMVKSMANVWTKKVASNFGATLKRLNALVALEQKRDEAAEKLFEQLKFGKVKVEILRKVSFFYVLVILF